MKNMTSETILDVNKITIVDSKNGFKCIGTYYTDINKIMIEIDSQPPYNLTDVHNNMSKRLRDIFIEKRDEKIKNILN